jgi:predicted transcriptional regulator
MNDTPAKSPMELTASVVAAYVANNTVAAAEIPNLIAQVHAALTGTSAGKVEVSLAPAKPAVPIKKSVTADHLICLEDGLKFKSLKRHLRTRYGMTPEQYRAKWNLPADYPMVARNYAATRSQLAKNMGLGQQRPRKGK